MRLGLVTNDYPPKPGGIQQYLGNLVAVWPGEVRVLAPHDGPAAETVAGEAIVSRYPPNLGPPKNFLWPTARVSDWAVAELRPFQPDAVLIGAPHPLTGLISRLRSSLDVPVGVLSHGAEVTIPSAIPPLRQILGSLLGNADVRFAVSRFTAARVERITGKPCRVVGAGVDIDTFVPVPHTDHAPLVIGCVSRFVPRKNHRMVIDAADRLIRSGTPCEVVMVGKGRLEARLRRQAAKAGVPVRFEVDVPWSRLPDLYGSFDVFCMPCRSRWGGLEVEGLGLVFLEAAATGLPVLAGDSGGAPETVMPGETGFVVRKVDDIVEALEILASDVPARTQMGSAARALVESEFTWERAASRFVDGFASARDEGEDLDT